MSSTITLNTTIKIASRFIYNAPLLYVNSGDLAYSIGDYVRQFMLAPPFAWRWNRAAIVPITLQAGQMDYSVNVPDFGWLEKATVSYPALGSNTANIVGAVRTGNLVTLTLNTNPIQLGFSQNQIISVLSCPDTSFNGYQIFSVQSLTSNTITYIQSGANATTAGGIVVNYNVVAPNVSVTTKELEVKQVLSSETRLGEPAFISPVLDDNNGNITFRLLPVPDNPYTLDVIYQKAAPTFSSTNDTWAPIPDYYSYLYNLGYLSKVYEYKGDERFAFTQQEFLKQVIAANDGLSETDKNIFLGPYLTYQRELENVRQTGALARQGRIG